MVQIPRGLCGLLAALVLAATLFSAAAPADLAATEATATATLVLTITDLRGRDGMVYIAVYDDPARFPEDGGQRHQARVPVTGPRVTVALPGLSPGRYAVAAFHDEDGDAAFDQGLFGIPLEGFGFTRDAAVMPATPAFEDAAIRVSPPKTQARFRMRYAL